MDATELQQLYQDVIVDHNRSPRNFKRLEPCDQSAGCHHADGFNPLCGDKLQVFLQLEDGKVADLSFEGSGCAISIASASLMTEAVRGMHATEARALFQTMHAYLTGQRTLDEALMTEIGKLSALGGVAAFPMRVKCATLCWHTLEAALDGENSDAIASTE
jgi:nitrogen fixation protein NifU and related proteins